MEHVVRTCPSLAPVLRPGSWGVGEKAQRGTSRAVLVTRPGQGPGPERSQAPLKRRSLDRGGAVSKPELAFVLQGKSAQDEMHGAEAIRKFLEVCAFHLLPELPLPSSHSAVSSFFQNTIQNI